jgi:hypothetical protein
MPQVQSRVVNHVEKTPAHRKGMLFDLAEAIQVGVAQAGEDSLGLLPRIRQPLDDILRRAGLLNELSRPIARRRAAPDHLDNPEALRPSAMGNQASQGID